MRLLWILVAVVVLAGAAWYLVSPAFKTVELNEAAPVVSKDEGGMDPETKAAFDAQVEAVKDEVKTMDDAMPAATSTRSGTFKAAAHDVAGTALLVESDGRTTLRFEEFETINGPDLRIYLASSLGDDDYVDLGPIRATKGNVNYEVPSGTDTTKYNKVLVWCVPFGVLFSYAELM